MSEPSEKSQNEGTEMAEPLKGSALRWLSLACGALCWFTVGGSCASQVHFESFSPPELEFGYAALVSLDDSASDVHAYLPEQLRETFDSTASLVWRVTGASELVVQYGSDAHPNWEYYQYQLLAEEPSARGYGVAADSVWPFVMATLGDYWGISSTLPDLHDSAEFSLQYGEFKKAVSSIVALIRPLMDEYSQIRSVHVETHGTPVLSLYSEDGRKDINLSDSLTVIEVFGQLYGGSVVPAECRQRFNTGRYVLIRYLKSTIQLVFAFYPENAPDWDLLFVMTCPVEIRLQE